MIVEMSVEMMRKGMRAEIKEVDKSKQSHLYNQI